MLNPVKTSRKLKNGQNTRRKAIDEGSAFGIGHTDYGDFTKLNTREYVHNANQEILTIGQIETIQAVENLNEILAAGELDVVFIGSL